MRTPCENPACGHVDDSEHPAGHICPQPRADNPRADLVALFDAFADAAPAYSSLQLHGDTAAQALLDWGHGARAERRDRPGGSAVLVACLDLPNGAWIVAHFDREPAAQADQQVLARVQEALDGEQSDRDEDSNRIMDRAEIEAREGKEQPEAAEGSV